jgi:arylsulfatase A-like enzyme
MKRYQPIMMLLAGIFAARSFEANAQGPSPPARPNIIFILADDLGYGDVGCFYQNTRTNAAQPRMFTPQLDRMAAEGMKLLQHYSSCPVCAPARASLLLGQSQGNCAIRDNQFDKALPDNHTLATVLKQAGYYCGAIGKWGLAGQSSLPSTGFTNAAVTAPGYPLLHGFDEFFGFVDHQSGHVYYHDAAHPLFDGYTNVTSSYENIYSTDLFFARAKKFVADRETAAPGQPFFLYLAPTAVHSALQVPGGPFPAGGGTNGGLQWPLSPVASPNTWIDPAYTNATTSSNYFNAVITSTNWNDAMKRYATMDRRLDDGVGDLLQLLRDLNIASNTLVVFSSDNGPANEGDGGGYVADPRYFDSWGKMDGIKRDLWEAGVREPTMVWWPGTVPADADSELVSSFSDWLPTFAAVSGQVPPAESDGVSLLPTLTGSGVQPSRGYEYFEYNYNGTFPVDGGSAGMFARKNITARKQIQSIRVGDYVAVRYNITNATDPFRLYNVVADPHEDSDLSGLATNAARLASMSNLCAQVRMPNPSAPRPYDSEMLPAVTGVWTTNGILNYSLYDGAWPWVPDLDVLPAIATGQSAGLDLSVSSLSTNFAIRFEGYLTIPADGQYTFYLTDDSGAEMWIHDAHVIDDDFNHTGAQVAGSIQLRAGLHSFRLFYRHATGPRILLLQYAGPGISQQPVPLNLFSVFSTNVPPHPTAVNDAAATSQNTPVTLDVLANDYAGNGPGPLRIVSVGTPLGGTATTNLSGQIVYTPSANFLGDDRFDYTMSDGSGTASATVNVAVYFTDGMLWFPFNQTYGLITSDAGGAYTATLNGFANDPAEWVAGKWNMAIQFNGSNNDLSIENYTGVLGAGDRTVAAWVRTTSAVPQPVIAWGPNTTGNKWTFLVQNGHARIEITSGYLEGTTLVNDGQWHYVACVFAGSHPDITNAALYVDGVRETSFAAVASRTVNTASSGNVLIGGDVQARFFNGAIDEPRIYNRALSPAAIESLVNATNQSFAAWQHRFYRDAVVNPNTPDAAGNPCLLDYALGVEPWLSTPAQLAIHASLLTNAFQVSFPRRQPGTSELVYQLQASPDLKSWSPWTAEEQRSRPLAIPNMENAVYQSDPESNRAIFIRMEVSLP